MIRLNSLLVPPIIKSSLPFSLFLPRPPLPPSRFFFCVGQLNRFAVIVGHGASVNTRRAETSMANGKSPDQRMPDTFIVTFYVIIVPR